MYEHIDAAIVYALAALLVGEFSVMSLRHGRRINRKGEPTATAVATTYLIGSLAWPIMLIVMIMAGRDKAKATAAKKGPWDAR